MRPAGAPRHIFHFSSFIELPGTHILQTVAACPWLSYFAPAVLRGLLLTNDPQSGPHEILNRSQLWGLGLKGSADAVHVIRRATFDLDLDSCMGNAEPVRQLLSHDSQDVLTAAHALFVNHDVTAATNHA